MADDKIRHLLFELARFLPREDGVEEYDCSQAHIDDYQRYNDRNRKPLKDFAEAAQDLKAFFDRPLTRAIREAFQRLRTARQKARWTPHIILKALHDLDLSFFDSRLRGNVIVSWANDETIIERFNRDKEVGEDWTIYGLMLPDGEGRCLVYLNFETILDTLMTEESYAHMWQTMFHELVHAYEYITTGAIKPAGHYDCWRRFEQHGTNGHGWHFRFLLSCIDDRAHEFLEASAIGQWEEYRLNVQEELNMIFVDGMRLRAEWQPSSATPTLQKLKKGQSSKLNGARRPQPSCPPVKKEPRMLGLPLQDHLLRHSSRPSSKVISTKRHRLIKMPINYSNTKGEDEDSRSAENTILADWKLLRPLRRV